MAQKKTRKSTGKKKSPASRKKKTPSRLNWKKVFGWTFLVILLSGALFIGAVYAGLFGRIPTRTELMNIRHPIASEIYGNDGTLLGKYFIENRSETEFDELTPFLVNALIATEDARFYSHHGIDYRSLLRVLVKSVMLMDRSSGGGSTITQQLAKNLYPRKKYPAASTLINKTREMILAARIEDVYDKDEILTLYLNTVPFGENVFGIGVATERFFNTHPSRITPEQAATLVGMLKATTYYSPRLHPERSKKRRNLVLDQMGKYHFITPVEADKIKARPLVLDYSRKTDIEGLAIYFRKHLKKDLEEWCAAHFREDGEPYNLFTDGLRIYTSIDPKLQAYAEQSVRDVLGELQNKFDDQLASWAAYYEPLEQATKRSRRYQNLKARGLDYKSIQASFSKKTPMQVYVDGRMKQVNMSPIDSIKHYLRMLQGALLVLDPKTGEVKAWVGGTDYRQFGIDYVTTPRQVGSTFKPFVYTAALEEGYDPCTYYDNERFSYPKYKDWSPRNANGEYGGSYSMSGALMNSVNTVSVQVLFDAGIEHVIDLAKRCGIESPIPEVPSIALGTAELNLLEMVSAYATLGNDGYRVDPVYIRRIEDEEGNILESFDQTSEIDSEQVVSDTLTQEIIQMLEKVIDEGTARRLRFQYGFDFDIAGKTGTTQDHSDGWFIGITPGLVGGAWVGANDRRIHFQNLSDGQGARTALPIWGSFFTKLESDPVYRNRLKKPILPTAIFAGYEPDCVPYSEETADVMNTEYDRQLDLQDELDALFNQRDDRKRRPRRRVSKESRGLKGLLESIFGKKDPGKKRSKRKKRRKK